MSEVGGRKDRGQEAGVREGIGDGGRGAGGRRSEHGARNAERARESGGVGVLLSDAGDGE